MLGLVRNATKTGWILYGDFSAVLFTKEAWNRWRAYVIVHNGKSVPQHQQSVLAQGRTLQSILPIGREFVTRF
jgi:hypothetical protein